MSNTWLIGCTHFNHRNILTFKDAAGHLIRPGFESVEHMNEHIISNWNRVVKPNDLVLHLGDVYFHTLGNILQRCNGHKQLIIGNHDNGKDQNLTRSFDKILQAKVYKDLGLVLTHMPVHESGLSYGVNRNIHAHTHKFNIDDPRYINVCVEQIDYTPVNLDQILAM